MSTHTFGNRSVETSNEDKVMFPDCGVTKGDLIEYYEKIADTILPHMRDRAVVMHRFPDGIQDSGFYHKDTPDYFPDWIRRETVRKSDGTVEHVVCEDAATLAFLADQACITPHVWLSTTEHIDRPDHIVLDLDPSDHDFEMVRRAAGIVCKAFDEIGLPVFLQLTGSRGIHVVSPVRPDHSFDDVRDFAQRLAKLLAGRHADLLTVEQRKNKRGNRVYLDTNRIAYAQTMVTPYAVRARPGAPVATPIRRAELGDSSLGATSFNTRNILRRIGQMDDPWQGIGRRAISLDGPAEKLDGME